MQAPRPRPPAILRPESPAYRCDRSEHVQPIPGTGSARAARFLGPLLPILGAAWLAGCANDCPTSPATSAPGAGHLVVSVALPARAAGRGEATRVALYDSFGALVADRMVAMSLAPGTEALVIGDFTDLPPGAYFIDAWKDVDSDGFDRHDYYGIVGEVTGPDVQPAAIVISVGTHLRTEVAEVPFP